VPTSPNRLPSNRQPAMLHLDLCSMSCCACLCFSGPSSFCSKKYQLLNKGQACEAYNLHFSVSQFPCKVWYRRNTSTKLHFHLDPKVQLLSCQPPNSSNQQNRIKSSFIILKLTYLQKVLDILSFQTEVA
jgi:hypothetical protein